MHILLAILNTLVGGLLIRRAIRIADGTADLRTTVPPVRAEGSATYWALIVGTVGVAVFLLLLAGVLLIEGVVEGSAVQ